MWEFIAGSTFKLAGQILLNGQFFDMTGWTITAKVFTADGDTLIATLSSTWVNAQTGLLGLAYGSTAEWPPGKARIDVALLDTYGNTYLSKPDYFRISESPLI